MESKSLQLLSPITGKTIPLTEVPDPVFSTKMMGDGIAIIPSEGKIYSPVDGEITMIAATKHAYGIKADNGLELLIHFGLETVALNGEGFTVHVQAGDKIKAGTLIAEVDFSFMQQKNINLITPFIICGGMENMTLNCNYNEVTHGEDAIITLTMQTMQNVQNPMQQETKSTVEEAPKKKFHIDFDFLQKLGKVLMTVIAVMPAAGLMISLGKLIQMCGADISLIMIIGNTMENIGWAIIGNLHILFAAAIGGSWAKEKAGGAFAAIIAFILINRITGSIFGVTTDMLSQADATTYTLLGQTIPVKGYFVSQLDKAGLLRTDIHLDLVGRDAGHDSFHNTACMNSLFFGCVQGCQKRTSPATTCYPCGGHSKSSHSSKRPLHGEVQRPLVFHIFTLQC